MITPLMHILSCLDEKFEIGSPVDILYLSKQDRELIINEAKRLGSLFSDEERIWIEESDTGKQVVSEYQVISGQSTQLNPYTSMLLTRVWQCYAVYMKELNMSARETDDDDLSEDGVVLRLEGHPDYIYSYVFKLMETPALSYDTKIDKLRKLLITIVSHSVVEDVRFTDNKLHSRLELHSKLSYWKSLLMADYIAARGTIPPEFNSSTIETIRKEIADLGFYGFVNPLTMYQEFSKSLVTRKVSVTVNQDVVDYLFKVVRSGGVSIE